MNPAQAIGTISAAGKEAGRAGRPHTANPHTPDSREAMAWFESWHVATVERETGEKIVPGLPDADTGLLMFARKKDLDL